MAELTEVLTRGKDECADIVGALVKAMTEVGAVGKDSEHNQAKTGKWKYRSADAVINAVQPALITAGVVVIPTITQESTEPGRVELHCRYTFYAATDGSSITATVVARAFGNTPFTVGAALSYAVKYCLSQVLMIPFDDDRMDVESDTYAETGRQDYEETGPGRFADPDDVADMLARIKAGPPGLGDEYKGEVGRRVRSGYSWSFKDTHKWTVIELRDATAWVMAQSTDEPWPAAPGDRQAVDKTDPGGK